MKLEYQETEPNWGWKNSQFWIYPEYRAVWWYSYGHMRHTKESFGMQECDCKK